MSISTEKPTLKGLYLIMPSF